VILTWLFLDYKHSFLKSAKEIGIVWPGCPTIASHWFLGHLITDRPPKQPLEQNIFCPYRYSILFILNANISFEDMQDGVTGLYHA
jgi:hypothetical protein